MSLVETPIRPESIVAYLQALFADKLHDTRFRNAVFGVAVFATPGRGNIVVVVGANSPYFAPEGPAKVIKNLWRLTRVPPEFMEVKIGGQEGLVISKEAENIITDYLRGVSRCAGTAGDVRHLDDYVDPVIKVGMREISKWYGSPHFAEILTRLRAVGVDNYSQWQALVPKKLQAPDGRFADLGLRAHHIVESSGWVGDDTYRNLRARVVNKLMRGSSPNAAFITKIARGEEKALRPSPAIVSALANIGPKEDAASQQLYDPTPLVDSLCAHPGVYNLAMSRFFEADQPAVTASRAIITSEVARLLLIQELEKLVR